MGLVIRRNGGFSPEVALRGLGEQPVVGGPLAGGGAGQQIVTALVEQHGHEHVVEHAVGDVGGLIDDDAMREQPAQAAAIAPRRAAQHRDDHAGVIGMRQRHGEGGPLPQAEHRAGRGRRVLVPGKQQQAQDLPADEPRLVVAGGDDELAAVLPAPKFIQGQACDIDAQALRLAPAPPTRGHRDLRGRGEQPALLLVRLPAPKALSQSQAPFCAVEARVCCPPHCRTTSPAPLLILGWREEGGQMVRVRGTRIADYADPGATERHSCPPYALCGLLR